MWVPVAVSGGHTFSDIGASRDMSNAELAATCGITTAGDLLCWGDGDGCRLATGICSGSSAVPVPSAAAPDFTQVATGGSASCALTATGAAYCWGGNFWGDLGRGHTGGAIGEPHGDAGSGAPTASGNGLSFRMIDASASHSCGVTTVGAAYCWGARDWGALGDGQAQFVLVPVQINSELRFR